MAGVTVGPSTVTPTASEGPSDVTGRIKIKIKTGAKRVRAASTEPGAAAGASDVSPGQPAAGPAKASGALQRAGDAWPVLRAVSLPGLACCLLRTPCLLLLCALRRSNEAHDG